MGQFIQLPKKLMGDAAQIGPAALAVYTVLASHANGDGVECWPSHGRIAAMLGISRNSVIRHIKTLAQYGYVIVERRWDADGGQTSNAYTLPLHPSRGGDGGVANETHPLLQTEHPPCASNATPPVTRETHELYTDELITNAQAPANGGFVGKSGDTTPAASGADAPMHAEAQKPTTFADTIRQLVRDAQTAKNKGAALRHAFITLYGDERDVPAYGYLMKTARKVGGPGRLVELLAQHAVRPPSGDVLSYIIAANSRNGKAPDKVGPSAASRVKVLS